MITIFSLEGTVNVVSFVFSGPSHFHYLFLTSSTFETVFPSHYPCNKPLIHALPFQNTFLLVLEEEWDPNYDPTAEEIDGKRGNADE